MTQKKITLFGKKTPIGFDMSTQIGYEEIAEVPFSINDLTKAKARICLYMACIITGNEKTTITIDDLLHKATAEDIANIDAAVNDLLMDFYKIPKVVADSTPAEEEGEESPNH